MTTPPTPIPPPKFVAGATPAGVPEHQSQPPIDVDTVLKRPVTGGLVLGVATPVVALLFTFNCFIYSQTTAIRQDSNSIIGDMKAVGVRVDNIQKLLDEVKSATGSVSSKLTDVGGRVDRIWDKVDSANAQIAQLAARPRGTH